MDYPSCNLNLLTSSAGFLRTQLNGDRAAVRIAFLTTPPTPPPHANCTLNSLNRTVKLLLTTTKAKKLGRHGFREEAAGQKNRRRLDFVWRNCPSNHFQNEITFYQPWQQHRSC